MSLTESQKRAKKNYNSKNTKGFKIVFYMNNSSDRILYDYLSSKTDKNKYIKGLLSNDLYNRIEEVKINNFASEEEMINNLLNKE